MIRGKKQRATDRESSAMCLTHNGSPVVQDHAEDGHNDVVSLSDCPAVAGKDTAIRASAETFRSLLSPRASAGRGVVWLEPELQAEISYAEVMQGRLRAAVFRRLLDGVLPSVGLG